MRAPELDKPRGKDIGLIARAAIETVILTLTSLLLLIAAIMVVGFVYLP